MEPHGKNQPNNVIAILPARLGSTRLERKMLLDLAGKPLILHTLEKAQKARNVSRVIVATDSEQIFDAVEQYGGEAVMTSIEHQSGSDRIGEVAEKMPVNSIIVNVQGDEPIISPITIEKTVDLILNDPTADIATASEQFDNYLDILNANVVKVVTDKNGFALYFSRSAIPFPREPVIEHGSLELAFANDASLIHNYRKHVGIYAYRREFLLSYTQQAQTMLEKSEFLEQLRAMENGARIKVVGVDESSIAVDTREDFEKVERILAGDK